MVGTTNKTPLGIYLHIPYCREKCAYCDFNSYPCHDTNVPDLYIDALVAQLRSYTNALRAYCVDTIYIGGGTPSLLRGDQLHTIMTTIRDVCTLTQGYECTIEANPESGSLAFFKNARACGVNRVSIGLQAIQDDALKMLGRIHTKDAFDQCFNAAKAAGFTNINIDLLFGTPNQTPIDLKGSLAYAISKNPTHICTYALKIEEGTAFHKRLSSLTLPDEDMQNSMYEYCIDTCRAHGYTQYEISNFAKVGNQSKHNLKYWHVEEYLGIGAGAHSDFQGKRFSTIATPRMYIHNALQGKLVPQDQEEKSVQDRLFEYVMLGFRLNDGIDITDFSRRFDCDFEKVFEKPIKKFIQHNCLEKKGDRYALTLRGIMISNYILSDFMAVLSL